MKVLATPFVGHWIDRSRGPRGIAILLGLGTVGLYAALWSTEGWALTLVLALALGAVYGPIVPLLDSCAVGAAHGQPNGTYGKIRRWGSLAFIAASLLGGLLLENGNEEVVIATLTLSAMALALILFLVPEDHALVQHSPSASPAAWSEIIPILITTSFLHGSHAMLYGFGSVQWQADRVAESTIGWLWTFGVMAEIAVFSLSHKFAHWNGAKLLIIASLGGLIRWPMLALFSDPLPLFFAQALHALTFGALHLGAMTYIQNRVRPAATSRVTSYYSASSGFAIGISLLLVGVLQDSVGKGAYFAMCGFSTAGLLGALYCRKQIRQAQREQSAR